MAAPNPGPRRRRTHVDPRELRPSRAWFWVGGTLLALSVVAGAVLVTLLFVRAVALPEFAASTRAPRAPPSPSKAPRAIRDGSCTAHPGAWTTPPAP
ncbi:hypothetical protein [Nocardiopsis prasina]|uniref:hypothetical protein n=1 Tax=Nocardiopsis prasina TaxID=2015 RepID=UPI001267CAD6|nr:hypothetical protein [Nocardiopsis prasina]